jgi:hypothetical protein
MILLPADSKNDLFQVIDPLSDKLIEQIKKENFWHYDWELQDMQKNWNRRKLVSNEL